MSSKNQKFMGLDSTELWMVPIGLLAIAAVVFTILVANVINMGDKMWEEAAKASLNLATGIILGGFLKLLLDAHSRAQETRTQRSDFRLDIVNRLELIIDQLETARLLINANRSARTYEEQMRQLLGVRAAVSDVLRSIQTVGLEMDDSDLITSQVKQMEGYIEKLGEEYAKRYSDVAAWQSYDEALIRSKIEQSVNRGDEEPPALEDKAWAMLCEFPLLKGFLKDDEYHATVVLSCTKAVALLRGKLLNVSVPASEG